MTPVTSEEIRAAFGPELRDVRIIDRIAKRVAETCNIPLDVMRSTKRDALTAHARQLAMFKAHQSGCTLSGIGRYFQRDHTTVLHGVRRVQAKLTEGTK